MYSTEKNSKSKSQNDHLAAFYFLSAISLVVVLVFNYLAATPNDTGIFHNTITNISDTYSTPLTPAGFTFAVWAVIYLFQIGWVFYALTSLCRETINGPLYENPIILPVIFHVCYVLGSLGNIGFLFGFDRERFVLTALAVILNTIFVGLSLVINCNLTFKNKDQIAYETRRDLKLIYLLIQNGLDLYFSWILVASHISVSIAVIYSDALGIYADPETSTTILLCILLSIIIMLNVMNLTMNLDYFKYVYAGYFVFIWAFIGVLAANYEPGSINSMLEIIGILVSAFFLVFKIVLVVYKSPSGKPKKHVLA